ncbi:MAG: polyprenyl synthetase family protein [Ignavibacteriaceae bacterium]|nr:polyprenyl synthetase family protein [Ignavibacteriaceae bacterium]
MGSKEKLNIPVISGFLKPVKEEVDEFNRIFKTSMKSNVALVDIVTSYILKQKGKKIRPALVLLSAKLCGGVNESSYRGAVLVELLHTATLVHDDVVDSADKRRGLPSINAVWKNKVAVLIGDYLLSRGLNLAVASKDYEFLEIITDTVKRMAEGELLQIQKTRKLDIDEATYFKVISDKTASLIETCCKIGALSAHKNEEHARMLADYGNALGLAFQIQDDILDYEGVFKLFGKPIGGDIKEKKITLPLIYALNAVDDKEKKRIKALIKKGSHVKEVIEFTEANGGIARAHQTALQFAEKASGILSNFPDSESKTALEALIRFVVERKS